MKEKNNGSEGWGMGFLLVFFPEEDPNHIQNQESKNKTPQNLNLFLKRANSSNLLHKAQSTISICLLLFFTSLLLFTLSTLPTTTSSTTTTTPRRHLHENPSSSSSNFSHALQGMGTLYRRGTKAMNDLIVAHAVESLTLQEFKLFLRLIYRSSLTSKSDLLFLFPLKFASFETTIARENESFLKLIALFLEEKQQGNGQNSSERSNFDVSQIVKTSEIDENDRNSIKRSNFDVTQFVKMSKNAKESGEPIWGRRNRANFSEVAGGGGGGELTRASYGSVVGFDADELDPENTLSGFLDHVPMSLRRWACYPMLLGRVRRNFKHVMLVDMKEFLVTGDPMGRIRSRSPESVLLKVLTPTGKHGRKNLEKTHKVNVNPGVVMGGSRGVRRLSNAMLTDIVKTTMQHKKKNPISETGLLSNLVGNEFASKNVNFIVSSESVPELSSLIGSSKKLGGSQLFTSNQSVLIRRGNSNLDVNSVVMKHICSFPIDSRVYSDC